MHDFLPYRVEQKRVLMAPCLRSMIGAFNNPDFVISKTYFKIPFPIYEKQMSQAYDVCEIAFS